MELLSTAFQETVSQILNNKRVSILATIPVKGARLIPLIEELRCNPEAKVFEVCYNEINFLA
jgi:nucleoside-triphosphatase THEP1